MTAKEKKSAAEFHALQKSCDEMVELIMQETEKVTSAKFENMTLVKKNQECTLELQDMKTKLQQYEADCAAQVNALHQMTSKEEKAAAELQALQKSCEEKVEFIMQEKDKEITSAKLETITMAKKNLECTFELENMNTKLQQCEADCEAKVNALQERLAQEKKEKEELHEKRTDMEESWLSKERHWLK
ncbi:hypothetical protein INR49_030742 [Caranx melampygus]|nr:hypothetical protein INR49_030742 [Caranx melampygus]